MTAASEEGAVRAATKRTPGTRLNLPVVGSLSLVVLVVAIAFALDRSRSHMLGIVMTLYGVVLICAIMLLREAVQRGQIWPHLTSIAAVTAAGFILPNTLNPTLYTVGAGGFPLIGTLLDQLFLYFKPWFVDPFSGILGDLDRSFWEFMNALALIVWCIAVRIVSFAGRKTSKVEAGSEQAPGYISPTLHNPTVARTLGIAAILTTAAMLVWGGLNASLDTRTTWAVMATGFPWFAVVAAIFHLCVLAQRRLMPRRLAAPVTAAATALEIKSVRSLFDSLKSAYSDHLAFAEDGAPRRGLLRARQLLPRPASDASADFDAALKILSHGGKVVQLGTADREFYRLFSEAVQAAQDQGRNVLVICPNGAGEAVDEALSQVTRFFSPEINQRWCQLTRADRAFSGRKLYDLILVEEDQFHDILVPRKGEFHHSLRRTRLIVLVDFHAIDACRLHLGLTQLEDLLDLTQESVLCLSRPRRGLEEQIKRLFDRGEKNQSIRKFAAPPNSKPTYRLAWNDGAALRKDFAKSEYRFRSPVMFDTGAYLSLVGSEEPFAGAMVVDSAINVPGDFRRLRDELNFDGDTDSANRIARVERLVHFAPHRNTRIAVVQDGGNLAEVLTGRYDFYRRPEDRLVHIVSTPYPARDFAFEWLKADPETFQVDALPFAQQPGVGLTELAVRVESALQAADGFEETALRNLLGQASGDLPKDLGLNETRGGLLRLFKTINPDLPQAALSARTNADQTHVFELDASSLISVLAQPAELTVEGGRIPLGRLSPRDEGLTFARGREIFLDQGPHRVERFVGEGHAIVVSSVEGQTQEHRRRARNLFRRTYTLHLNEGFAREQERAEGSLVRMHVHASFTRYSDRVLTWPVDEPLLSGDTHAPIGIVELTQKRSYRSIYLIAFGSPDYRPAEAYSPALRRTLAASLQDVLGLLFPALAQRIAVVDLAGEWGAGTAPPFNRLPLNYPIGRIEGGTIEESIRLAFRRVSHVGLLANLVDGWSSAALAVIEDAAHDIGVARRIQDSWPQLVPIWKRYLDWGAQGHTPWRAEDGWFDAGAASSVPLFSGN